MKSTLYKLNPRDSLNIEIHIETEAGIHFIIIIIRNLYSAIMPLGGYRGAGGTGR